MRRSLRASITVFALLLSLLIVPVAGAAPGDGNSGAAKLCQDGGFANYVRSNGTAFKNTGDCVSYAAQGGELKPKATLTATQDGGTLNVAGSGLQPGSTVTYNATHPDGSPEQGTVPGVVAPDGTFSFSGGTQCGYTNVTVTGTTASGDTITSSPAINSQPCS